MLRIRSQISRQGATPCKHKASHITEIVTSIRQQRQRIDPQSCVGFNSNECQVEGNTNRKGQVVIGRWRMRVPVLLICQNIFFPLTLDNIGP